MNDTSNHKERKIKLEQEKESTTETTKTTKRPGIRALREEIANLKGELEEIREKYLRQAAEFDNFRKRKQKESLEWTQSSRENLIRELLPVVDDFQRVFPDDSLKDDPQWKGVSLIYDKLFNMLRNQGLRPMDSLGKPFNPDYHDALLAVPRNDIAPGTVVEVHENGYLMNDRVIRHAKVVVSKEVETETDNDKETADSAQEK
jgi:molecular chaperone GrpE